MNYILFSILYLCVDLIWISIMSKLLHRKTRENTKTNTHLQIYTRCLAYITLLIIMFYICIPLSTYYKQHHPSLVFGLVGFCVYGVYNFTNGAIFVDYNWKFICVDTLWGLTSFLCSDSYINY